MRLDDATVHCWSIALDEQARAPRLRELLAPDERDRADRFHFERDAARFVAGRALLRRLLASYLGAPDPRAIPLVTGAHGKPRLADGAGLHFNIAHSGGFALLGVARDVEIGVDVEHVHDFPDMPRVMRASFAPSEVEAITALGEASRVPAFYRCWTRKEAVLKALGWGLARPLDSFGVSVTEKDPALLWMDGVSPDEIASWKLHHVRPAEGYVAAVAWSGSGRALQCWHHEP